MPYVHGRWIFSKLPDAAIWAPNTIPAVPMIWDKADGFIGKRCCQFVVCVGLSTAVMFQGMYASCSQSRWTREHLKVAQKWFEGLNIPLSQRTAFLSFYVPLVVGRALNGVVTQLQATSHPRCANVRRNLNHVFLQVRANPVPTKRFDLVNVIHN
jgi:hypothetical protein